MFFDIFNPFHWIRSILSTILILILILIPGWSAVFANKTFSEAWNMLKSDFWNTIGKAFSEAFSYYKSWFQKKETQEKIEKGKETIKQKAIEELEKKVQGEGNGE